MEESRDPKSGYPGEKVQTSGVVVCQCPEEVFKGNKCIWMEELRILKRKMGSKCLSRNTDQLCKNYTFLEISLSTILKTENSLFKSKENRKNESDTSVSKEYGDKMIISTW